MDSESLNSTSTILVVDDRGDDVLLLQRMFKNSHIFNNVAATHNVHDTFCYLKGEGIYSDRKTYPFPILVLLDLHLPDGSGFDVLRWIRSHPRQSPPAVVVLTGSDVTAIRESYGLGAHSFLVKPLRFEDFQNMVRLVRGIKLSAVDGGHILELE